MIIEIRELSGYFDGMGHRVAENHGGVDEVKRRCLETLSRLSAPPDEIRFHRLSPVTQAPSTPPPSVPNPVPQARQLARRRG